MLHASNVEVNPLTIAAIAHMPADLQQAAEQASGDNPGRAWTAAEMVLAGSVIPSPAGDAMVVMELDSDASHVVARIDGRWSCECGQRQCTHELAAAFAVGDDEYTPAGLVAGRAGDEDWLTNRKGT